MTAPKRRDGDQREVIGALIAERFDTHGDEHGDETSLRRRLEMVGRHGETALANAMEVQRLPLLPVLRSVAALRRVAGGRNFPKTLVALAAVLAVIAVLVLAPADFTIQGRGELQPVRRRDVFAPSDGVVREVLARTGDHVSAFDPQRPDNQVLAILRNPDLDFELRRVSGEIQTAEKRLAAVKASRLANQLTGPDARRQYEQLTAEQEELSATLESLRAVYKILGQQQAELTIGSPIDGEVLTWDVEQLLDARPVRRGQVLMTIADLDGPWELQLRVPDDQVGHVLDARRRMNDDLKVDFFLSTQPGSVYQGIIDKTALAAEPDEKDGAFVLVRVRFDRGQLPRLRPGATVVARIHCGRRSIGYVWLHDLWDAIQTRVLF